jgi:hypothetical protein
MPTPAEIANELLTLEAQLLNVINKISALRRQIQPIDQPKKKLTKRQETDEQIKRMIQRHKDKLVRKSIKAAELRKAEARLRKD